MEAARVYRREKCAKLYINDHKGAIDWPPSRSASASSPRGWHQLGVVDPVAALVAQEEDDRKALDRLFAEAKALAEELDITLLFNSHLTRPGPRTARATRREAGSSCATSGAPGRSSCGPASCSAWSGNQQSATSASGRTPRCAVLKDRFTGDSTGKTRNLVYNTLTGRLEEKVPELMKGS
jgi:twinkle protein